MNPQPLQDTREKQDRLQLLKPVLIANGACLLAFWLGIFLNGKTGIMYQGFDLGIIIILVSLITTVVTTYWIMRPSWSVRGHGGGLWNPYILNSTIAIVVSTFIFSSIISGKIPTHALTGIIGAVVLLGFTALLLKKLSGAVPNLNTSPLTRPVVPKKGTIITFFDVSIFFLHYMLWGIVILYSGILK